jgi:enediyne biosynthesis protein E4
LLPYTPLTWSQNVLDSSGFTHSVGRRKYPGTSSILYHNEGNGRFRDVSGRSGIQAVEGKGMGVAIMGVAINDYDADSFLDIFVSNDLMEQFLFHNRGNGTFEEVALTAGTALSPDGKAYSGIGASFADYDNDGRPDILVTNLAREKWALYRNEGQGQFSYASAVTGLAAATAPASGWGVGLYDFDNDGWKDVLAAQGHVLDNVERMDRALRYLEPPGLYRNTAGKFQTADLGSLPAVAGRGAAFGDLNNDGSMDAVIAVLGGRPLVLAGQPSSNHWLVVELTGTASNRDAMGARVRIGNQVVFATTSGSYLSANDRRVHFGLGKERKVTVEITWTRGKRQVLSDVAADQILR